MSPRGPFVRQAVARWAVLSIVSLLLPTSVVGQTGVEAISVEMAIRQLKLSPFDRPALSPDGRLLAYVALDTPPERSVTKQYGDEVTRRPNGMISRFIGSRLFIVDTETGETTEVNAGRGSNWDATFSPDGERVAFFSDAGGTPQVWVADVATGDARRVSEAQIFVKLWSYLDRPTWTADGSGLYVLTALETRSDARGAGEDREGSGPTVQVTASGAEVEATADDPNLVGRSDWETEVIRSAIERVDVETGRRTVLVGPATGPQPYAFEVSPSGGWVAHVSSDDSPFWGPHQLALTRIADGMTRELGDVQQIVYNGPASSDPFGGTFHWTPGSDRLVFARDSTVWLADLIGSWEEPRPLAPELGRISTPPPGGASRVDQPSLTADGSTVVARLGGNDPIAFAVIPLDGGEARRIVLSRPVRFRGMVYATRDVLWQPDPSSFLILGSDLETETTMVIAVDLRSGDHRSVLEGESSIRFLAAAGPGSIVGEFTDVATPPDLYVFDGALDERRRLTRLNPALDSIPDERRVTFASRLPAYDGTMRTLRTSVVLPVGFQEGDRPPAIVYIYPDNEMSRRANQFGAGRLGFDELSQLWTTRGYAVVLPDLSPVTPRLEGGGNLLREIRDYLVPQLYLAAERGYIDIERLVLTGYSYGGFGTVATLTETSLFRAAVAFASAPLDLTAMDLPGWAGTVARIEPGSVPWTLFKQYVTNSPYHQADKIRTPLLLLHGDADGIPPESSVDMFRGLQQLGKTAQLALYEGEPHHLHRWSRVNAIDAVERVLDFVDRYAGPDSDTPRESGGGR